MAGAPCHAHILWVPHIDVERPSGNLLAPAKNKKEGRQSHARPKLCKLQLLRLSPAPALKICYETIDEDLHCLQRAGGRQREQHVQRERVRSRREEPDRRAAKREQAAKRQEKPPQVGVRRQPDCCGEELARVVWQRRLQQRREACEQPTRLGAPPAVHERAEQQAVELQRGEAEAERVGVDAPERQQLERRQRVVCAADGGDDRDGGCGCKRAQ
mmetsp:Transcript_58525/g.127100  ORF Transcript_58525/g.127100 Transcript_58525/m.127100 type:complete len:215 (-) Transcript_58525:1042-1686(-)